MLSRNEAFQGLQEFQMLTFCWLSSCFALPDLSPQGSNKNNQLQSTTWLLIVHLWILVPAGPAPAQRQLCSVKWLLPFAAASQKEQVAAIFHARKIFGEKEKG